MRALLVAALISVAPAAALAQTTPPQELIRAKHYAPAAGELAPDFELRMLGSTETVRLSERLGDGRPVVLVFGSWT